MPYEWLRIAFTTIATFGIEPYEVVQVLSSAKRLPRPMASPEGVRALLIYGRTATGRPLVVVVRLTGQQRVAKIVGARDMTDAERKEFEAWESR